MSFITGSQFAPNRRNEVSGGVRAARGVSLSVVQSCIVAGAFCCFVVMCFLAASEDFLHWFILPVIACGVVVGTDAAQWLRGKVDVFDPVGIIGVLGMHFFFFAPLLHVHWNRWMGGVAPPPDWRDWLGGMALLNLCGLLLYRVAASIPMHAGRRREQTLVVRRRRFWPLLWGALIFTAVLQAGVYASFGGIVGYINAYTNRFEEQAFQGMGWVFMLAESFPILAVLGYAVFAQRRRWARRWLVVAIVIIVFVILKLLFGGLRGSRSNTVWGLFWAVGIIHFWVRPVSQKLIIAGLPILFAFMYVYGLYKSAGTDVMRALDGPAARAELEVRTGRSSEAALLGDLGRSDVQAFILYRVMQPQAEYHFGWGRTYVGAAAIMIPRRIWPNRPLTKVKEGTEIQRGKGSFSIDNSSSRVYGLAGEAMLNFGPASVPVALLLWGLLIGTIRKRLRVWEPHDARWLMVPLLINLSFVVLVGDSDNVLFFMLKNGLVPIVLLWVCSSWSGLGNGRQTDPGESRLHAR